VVGGALDVVLPAQRQQGRAGPIPAYLKDLFGDHEVGAIHGRLLTAWAAAGVAGPLIVNSIADSQGAAGKEGAALYELSLFIMVGVLVVGFIANLLVRPVSERYHLRKGSEAEAPARSGGAPRPAMSSMSAKGGRS